MPLGVKPEVSSKWVRRKLIASVVGKDRVEKGHRVTQKALDAFRQEYVTGVEVARSRGVRARWLSLWLLEAGVEAVSGPKVDGCRQMLFRRADIERVDLLAVATNYRRGAA